LDRNLADAHLAQGLIQLWNDWRPSDAARSFERSLALNPSLAAAHHDYAWALVALGRNDDAIRHITTARALDPLSTRATNDVGWLYLQLREPAEAARACEHTLAIGPASLDAQECLERAYAQRGSFEAALEAAKATMPPASGFRVIDGGAEAALRSIWRWRLDQLEQAAQIRWISPYTLAGLRAALGNSEKAIQDLESAYDEHDGMMVLLDRDPLMDGLRSDPRVQALIKRVNQQGSMTTAPTR
jgi:tetratricopeptide (TPR) repeat protein